MENYSSSKQKGSSSSSSSSSSSIATELFGPKATPSSSTSVFGSVFGPPPTGRRMDSSHQGNHTSWNQAQGNPKHGGPSTVASKDHKNTYYQQETVQPCHYSSSIYYGGQDVYSTPGHNVDSHQSAYKKDAEDDGSDGSQGHGASRGNWWQGSLYY